MSDQGLRSVSLMNIYREHVCRSLCRFNHKYHKQKKTADLGGHCTSIDRAYTCNSLTVKGLSSRTIFGISLLVLLIPISYYGLNEGYSLAPFSNRGKMFFVQNYRLSNDILVLNGQFMAHGINSSFVRSGAELKVKGIERLLNQIKPDMLMDEKFQRADLPYERLFRVNRNVEAVSCSEIFNGNKNETDRAVEVAKNDTRPREEITSAEYINRTVNCQNFVESRGYITSSLTKVEEEFPIAFSILMFKDVWQFERLLRAIYRPQNVYCIHVDVKAHNETKKVVAAISSCFNNVFLGSKQSDVRWGTMSVLEPELTCMQDLWYKSEAWKYFINLTGQEFPLKTNYELVQILTAYNGANDLQCTVKRANKDRWAKAGPPPHGLTPIKGAVHVVASRGYVDSVLHDQKIADLLNWTRHTGVPDETFFATVNHNPSLKVPGSYRGLPETNKDVKPFVARYKNWDGKCAGKRVRSVCVFGVGDLADLAFRKELFANKFYYNYQRFALDCLEELNFNHTRDEYLGKRGFDPRWYAGLGFVKNRADKL